MVIVRKNIAVFFLIAIITLLLGFLAKFYLPKRFFFDAFRIIYDDYNQKGLVGSYSFSMWFYDRLWINKLPLPVIALLQLSILFYLILKIGIPKGFHNFTLRNAITWFSILMFAFFLSMPTKEMFNFFFAFLFIKILFSKKVIWIKVVFCSLFMIAFGLWFRPYFILCPIIAIAIWLGTLLKIKNKRIVNLTLGILAAIFISLAHGVVKGQYISESTREKFNKIRIDQPNANSIILSPIDTSDWYGESISIIYGFISINFPINALKHILSPQILIFLLWQIALFVLLIFYFGKVMDRRHKHPEMAWVYYFLFSYFIVQGIFEPDLGSALRHKMGMFPLLFVALYYNTSMVKLKNTFKSKVRLRSNAKF
jgi:hypothetical protein